MLFIVGKVKKTDGTEDPTSLPSEGKITIKSFYLRVPIIEYNSEAQIKLINCLIIVISRGQGECGWVVRGSPCR